MGGVESLKKGGVESFKRTGEVESFKKGLTRSFVLYGWYSFTAVHMGCKRHRSPYPLAAHCSEAVSCQASERP